LVADLPITRAIMTAHDPATIQDASKMSGITGRILLVLANRNGSIVALHTKSAGLLATPPQQYFQQSLSDEDSSHWWFGLTISTKLRAGRFISLQDSGPLLASDYRI